MPRGRRLRAAALALCQTVRTVAEAADTPRLVADALTQCGRTLAASVADGELELQLSADAVAVEGSAVALLERDSPLARLRAAGIGSIVFDRSVSEATAVAFVRAVAALATPAAAPGDPIEALRRHEFSGIRLAAPAADECPPLPGGDPIDWQQLPMVEPAPELRRLAHAACRVNLRVAAARLLIADLDQPDDPAFVPAEPLLAELIDDLLAHGEAAEAAQVLEQLQHRRAGADGADIAERFLARARATCHGGWLAAQIAAPERLDGLMALAIELGEEAVLRLGKALAFAGLEPPPLLATILPATMVPATMVPATMVPATMVPATKLPTDR